jgi:hypothetical protein
LRSRDMTLESASALEPASGDIKIAEAEGGTVIAARPGNPKIVVIGYHPTRAALRYELVTPLLFANTLRWMAPDLFHRMEVVAGSAGAVTAALDTDLQPGQVRVVHEDGRPLPFTLRNRGVHFFSGTPGVVRVNAADREMVYSLTLPDLAEARWEPPASARRGLPTFTETAVRAFDLWQILACLGALGLLVEWILFGRFTRTRAPLSLVHRFGRAGAIRSGVSAGVRAGVGSGVRTDIHSGVRTGIRSGMRAFLPSRDREGAVSTRTRL